MIIQDNILKVMGIFFGDPRGKFHLRELGRLTGLSMPGVKKIVEKLEKENLLVSKKEKLVRNFSSVQNEKFIALKRVYNIYSCYSSGLVNLLKEKYEEPKAVVLFGSYSKGEDIKQSDIDIAIVTKKHLSLDLQEFEKKLKRKIIICEIDLQKAEKPFINSLINGIVLKGYLDLKK